MTTATQQGSASATRLFDFLQQKCNVSLKASMAHWRKADVSQRKVFPFSEVGFFDASDLNPNKELEDVVKELIAQYRGKRILPTKFLYRLVLVFIVFSFGSASPFSQC